MKHEELKTVSLHWFLGSNGMPDFLLSLSAVPDDEEYEVEEEATKFTAKQNDVATTTSSNVKSSSQKAPGREMIRRKGSV